MDYHFECAKHCFSDELLTWFAKLNSDPVASNLPALAGDLNDIAVMYGRQRLEQEYLTLVDHLFKMDEESQDPFDIPMEYNEQMVQEIEQRAGQKKTDDPSSVNFSDLFKLKLVSETQGKRFGLKTYNYEVEIAPIQFSFTNTTSIEAVPKMLEDIFDLCT